MRLPKTLPASEGIRNKIIDDISRSSSIRIPKKYENELFYQKIKKFLTRLVVNYNSDESTTITFFVETNNFLYIPRYFPIENFVNCQIVDNQVVGQDIDITSNIVPRNELQDKAIKHMLSNTNSLMELQPGVGKTVISIKVISELKKKSIIIVHRDSLVDQWKTRFLEFTSLKDDDISCLRSKSFEEDLTKPIIISTVQTFLSLLKRNYVNFVQELFKSEIGICIADEVHTSVAAPTFSQCSLYIPSKRTYGLSATPYRLDGNSDIIKFHLGETFKDEDVSGTMIPRVTAILCDFMIDVPKRSRYLFWTGVFQRSRYLNILKNSEEFMKLAKMIIDKVERENRNTIFISERLKLIDELSDYVKLKSDDVGIFIAGNKNDVLSSKMVFSTPGKIRDGVDCPWKDCLIMTSPISNISQLSGRVIRSYKNKETPIIIDMVDIGCKVISSTFYKRKQYYQSKEWPLKFLYVDSDYNMLFIDETEAMKLISKRQR